MIYIIDDDREMGECLARYLKPEKTRLFPNALEAVQSLDADPPDLIFLDLLLDGPDGFTFLNELVSYDETAKIPVVVVTSLDLEGRDLRAYGVRRILNKSTMTPKEVRACLSLI